MGRWDRFSWYAVAEKEGTLDRSSLIDALETVLIEAMEPPLNKKSGAGILEMIQREDPEIKKKQDQQKLQALIDRLNAA